MTSERETLMSFHQASGGTNNMMDFSSLILTDENKFFEIIQTMPDYREAKDLLNRARVTLIRLQNEQKGKGLSLQDMQATFARINAEVVYICERQTELNWRNAVKAIFGQDGYEKCILWLKEQEL